MSKLVFLDAPPAHTCEPEHVASFSDGAIESRCRCGSLKRDFEAWSNPYMQADGIAEAVQENEDSTGVADTSWYWLESGELVLSRPYEVAALRCVMNGDFRDWLDVLIEVESNGHGLESSESAAT